MLDLHLFLYGLEAEMPGFSATQPIIVNKAGPHFEMAVYPYKISAGQQPIKYSQPITPFRDLPTCAAEVSRHLTAAREFFLQSIASLT